MVTYKINDNVIKYRIGKPVNTGAVIKEGHEVKEKDMDFFKLVIDNNHELIYKMIDEDIILGLGENLKGINKRGGVFESYCSDDPNHTPDKKSLYGAHNFFMVYGKQSFGVFIDHPGKVKFDFGFTHKDILKISISDGNYDLYLISGSGPEDIVTNYLTLIGKPYTPPKWAFGFQQSRWSYENSEVVEDIVDRFIMHGIPCDTIYLDIDYMERYKDFTINEEKFPNFKEFIQKIKDKGFRLIPIIDAGVRIEDGYEIYEEGLENGYFCKDNQGNPFVGAVWPGKVHFPDFLNSEVRKWFGLKYKNLIDFGIEGFWNDMNEPAIFYTDEGLKRAINKAKESEGQNLDVNSFFRLTDEFIKLSNNQDDYKNIYHNLDGQIINHDKVHNLYGYLMTKAAAEGFEEIDSNKRFLIFSRSSFIGMHRYSGIWTGDNHSWWEHLLLNIKMMPSLNMCGFLYSGADTGGFSGDVNSELLIRWTGFSIFTPLFRNHSAMGTRRQEPFAFDEETTQILKRTIELRYALIPYIYSEYMKAVSKNHVYISPLIFDYDDELSKRVEDQLLVGESIMVSPIYQENARGRYVWLPDEMLLWKASDYRNRKYEALKKGHNYINIGIDEVPIFIRKNKILVLGDSANNIDNIKNDELTVIAFIEDRVSYVYYDDDGMTFNYKNGEYSEILINIEKKENQFNVNVINNGNNEVKKIKLDIVDIEGNVTEKIIDIDNFLK